jgi:hypothetical protein
MWPLNVVTEQCKLGASVTEFPERAGEAPVPADIDTRLAEKRLSLQ